MNYFKKLSVILLSSLLLVCFCVPAFAFDSNLYDNADLLSTAEEANLLSKVSEASNQYGLSITLLTYDDAEGKSTMVYTDDFYDVNVGATDGVLIAVDMDNREVYINTVGTAISNISDSEIDAVLDDTIDYASNGDYAGFFTACLDSVMIAYDGSYSDYRASSDGNGTVSPWMPTTVSLIATVVVMAIVCATLLILHNRNNKAPSAAEYMNSSFNVDNSNTVFMGIRHEVIHDYYKEEDSGGSSHMSSGGVSHGGGGRGF